MIAKNIVVALFAFTGFASIAHASLQERQAPASELPPSIQVKVDSLKADLEKRGFEVAQGAWKLFTIEDCKYPIAKVGMCFGNNPTAPYILPTLPLWPNEFVDPSMEGLFGPTVGETWATYRLDPREAIVIIGQMPPSGAYYGLQSYVFSREGVINTNDPIYKSVTDPFMKSILFMLAPNPSRVLTFASVGDSNNMVEIASKSGAAFDKERSFIITADAGMEKDMKKSLLRAGVPSKKHIFTERVSKDLVNLGLTSKADDMMTLMRYALPDDENAGNEWRQNLPLAVLRVREKNPSRPTVPYAEKPLATRTGVSEIGLQEDMNELVSAVKQKWGQPDAETTGFVSLYLSVDLVGPHCLKRPMDCLGDNSDADYQISATKSLDSDDVFAVVGTLGTKTGNATYASLSVNQIPELKGVSNLSQKDLSGTASEFADQVSNTDKFYVQYFARDCGNIQNCFEISEEMVPPGKEIKIILRNYVVPGSLRGADPTKVLNPKLLVLK